MSCCNTVHSARSEQTAGCLACARSCGLSADRRPERAAQVRLVALPVAGLVLVAAMAGMGMLPQDPLISFVILLQASPHPPNPTCT